MSAPIKHQIIEKDGVPLFVVVPYQEYIEIFQSQSDDDLYLPNEVVKAHALDDKTLVRAWREYKGMTQKEMSYRLGISQSAYSQMERSENPHESTLKKIASVMDIDWRLLTVDDE